MSGVDIDAANHAAFVAAPEQPCTQTILSIKAQGLAFLTALSAPASLLVTLLAPPLLGGDEVKSSQVRC
jgi:hypothetical protein